MTKKEMICILLRDDHDTMTGNGEAHVWLMDLLLVGFKGYANMTVKELKKEMKEMMDRDIL
jgi:hypothetical protein